MSSSAIPDTPLQPTSCKLTNDFEILRQLPVFASADIEVTKLFAYLAKRKKYRPGDSIIKYGKEANSSYLLISGKAIVTTIHRNEEMTLQHLLPGAFFGELALLAHFNWFFSVKVTKDAEVIMIDRQSFNKVLARFPRKREKIIEKIVQLRIERLKEQTTFFLDKLINVSNGEFTTTKVSL